MSRASENLDSFLKNPYTKACAVGLASLFMAVSGWIGNAAYDRIIDIYTALNDPVSGVNHRIDNLKLQIAEQMNERTVASDAQIGSIVAQEAAKNSEQDTRIANLEQAINKFGRNK